MGRKDEDLIAKERIEIAKNETARFGKELGSMPESEEERRQQALAMLRKKAQAKRDGKRVAIGKSVAVGAHKQAKRDEMNLDHESHKQAKRDGKRVAGDECMADDARGKDKRDGKRVAIDESVVDIAPKQAPPKRQRAPRKASVGTPTLEKGTARSNNPSTQAKAPKQKSVELPPPESEAPIDEELISQEGSEDEQVTSKKKAFNPNRDRQKTPTEKELLEQLKHGVYWPPTRFADLKMMKELDIDQDMRDLLTHMNLGSFYSMAYPTYKEVSCQFLATLEASFHSARHDKQGWGQIKFKIDGTVYTMTFAEIGEVLGLRDLKEPSMPQITGLPKGKTLAQYVFKLLSGEDRKASRDKNISIRHPSVRYLHRLIVHTIFPRKELSNVNGEDLCFMHQALHPYASLPHLPEIPADFYDEFGMVGFLVKRLQHYKSYAWTTRDPDTQIGIGGLITPLLQYKGIHLGDDASGPSFIDLTYLKSVHYFSGRFNGQCVYSYKRGAVTVELVLPNFALTNLRNPGALSFDISVEHLLTHHGPLGPMILPSAKKRTDKAHEYFEDCTSSRRNHLFGPPRYHFDQRPGVLPLGPLRQAHDHIGNLQRWNKAQDRTIFKLTKKCKELKKTVKRQAEASAKFMKRVTDLLTRGAVAGCTAEDFEDIFAPQPLPVTDPSIPPTRRQMRRTRRNPEALPSNSGNKSPSLASTDEANTSADEASASSHAP